MLIFALGLNLQFLGEPEIMKKKRLLYLTSTAHYSLSCSWTAKKWKSLEGQFIKYIIVRSTLTGFIFPVLKSASLSETAAVLISFPVILPWRYPLPVKSVFSWGRKCQLIKWIAGKSGGNLEFKTMHYIIKNFNHINDILWPTLGGWGHAEKDPE